MRGLQKCVAVVAGGSRGAGRGIARALGAAGATVYVGGRTERGGPAPADGAAGTIDDTAEEVSERGGRGIAVRTDFTDAAQVAALFERVVAEQGRVDVLANAVWGAADGAATLDAVQQQWTASFWEQPAETWRHMMEAGPGAYYLAGREAARVMVGQRRGLIVGVTDGLMGDVPPELLNGTGMGEYHGQLVWDLAHQCINRLMRGMSVELKKHRVAVVTLMPGFMRTERVEQHLQTEEQRRRFGYERSETPEYLGRAVAALAGDRGVLRRSGRVHFVADLAAEYGFTDVDGRQPPKFSPY